MKKFIFLSLISLSLCSFTLFAPDAEAESPEWIHDVESGKMYDDGDYDGVWECEIFCTYRAYC